MSRVPATVRMRGGEDQQIAEAVERETSRLRNFIRSRVANREDAEDLLQEVFYEFVVAYRLMKPVEHAGAWLFQVARNRITDLLRKPRPETLGNAVQAVNEDGDSLDLEALLPSADAGPEAAYARTVLIEEFEDALNELPDEQRDVFIAHEFEGRSFKELSQALGVGVNTLLARKRYAVLHLRDRLRLIYEEFKDL